jgi:uncharacterized membrane protein
MQSNVKRQKLILTSILLMGAFSYPAISIANQPVMVGGIPLLFLYVLAVWIIAIIVFASIAHSKPGKKDE